MHRSRGVIGEHVFLILNQLSYFILKLIEYKKNMFPYHTKWSVHSVACLTPFRQSWSPRTIPEKRVLATLFYAYMRKKTEAMLRELAPAVRGSQDAGSRNLVLCRMSVGIAASHGQSSALTSLYQTDRRGRGHVGTHCRTSWIWLMILRWDPSPSPFHSASTELSVGR